MANIKFVREYEAYGSTWYNVLYAKSNRLYTFTTEDLPETVKRWLKGRKGIEQYDRVFKRDEIIYKAETVYKVEFDFRVNGKDVHDYLDNNGKGFSHDDAVSIGRQLAEQGNTHVMVIAI